MTVKAAIYARYSSALQDSRSIDDQVAACRTRAEREGWEIVEVFADYAISGAVRDRPSLNAMLARAGTFDMVLSEAIDRVSRHQADSATIFETLKFHGCRLFTLSEGEISELHIGLKGTMAALFRADLADKIKRGQRGRVAAGRIPGGLCYGYRKVARLSANGEPELGLREIDPDQAEVVRRIYREFNAGLSAVAIARRLNAEGVPAPSGGLWRVSMINGDRVRRNGILQNEIYIGQLVYNRTRMMRDPVTRKRLARVNPEIEWVRQSVPALRIVEDSEWDAVRARRAAASGWSYGNQRRPKRMLSGLTRCGVCGGTFIVIGTELWGCGNARTSGTCANHRKITTPALERRVLAGLTANLLTPDMVSLYVREYHEHHARERAQMQRARARLEQQLAEVARKVDRLVDVIARGAGEIEEVVAALRSAKAERARIERALEEIAALPVIALHPNVADNYRRNVESLAGALSADPEAATEVWPAIRSLIDRIVLTPATEKRGVEIEVFGRMASIIALATGKPAASDYEPMMSVVAEEGSLGTP